MGERRHDNPAARNPKMWTPRRDTVEEGFGHDAYEAHHHLAEPTVCTECEAVYHRGRWTWMDEPPPGGEEALCPACRRVRDQYPAGLLRLDGPFALAHEDDLVRLAQNEAAAETAEHPLNRVIQIETDASGILITTTDVHLPRRIGEAIERAFHGHFDLKYAEEDQMVRARWAR